ncbi:MAG TPA: TIGR03557 family F420-dependent LLM class oxidoreductase [Acidimicrobiales bacterium]|nr:TIGR03557 family F420-dependent LLM class oxidoreductase [Acidimicrobiales bacterium]
MRKFGYTLSSEEHGPRTLVENARHAEDAGFDFVSISDHIHPWIAAQGHSPFVWSVLGGIACTTSHIDVGIGVSCPTTRMHPTLVAHASSTVAQLLGERFFLGVGTGEALNEHVLGHRWPRHDIRLKMLEEAVAIIRELWSGETVNYDGRYYRVENTRIFDAPGRKPPIIVSGFGEQSVELAAKIGDGYWGHGTDPSHVERFTAAGGHGPKYAQVSLCWGHDTEQARKTVLKYWPVGGLGGQLMQDLPTWNHFEQAVESISEEQVLKSTPCGPDVEPILKSVEEFVTAGFDHIYFHQIGPDQRGFIDFWAEKLRPALGRFG